MKVLVDDLCPTRIYVVGKIAVNAKQPVAHRALDFTIEMNDLRHRVTDLGLREPVGGQRRGDRDDSRHGHRRAIGPMIHGLPPWTVSAHGARAGPRLPGRLVG